MRQKRRICAGLLCTALILAASCGCAPALGAATTPTQPPSTPAPVGIAGEAAALLDAGIPSVSDDTGAPIPIHSVSADAEALTVCIETSLEELSSGGWLGVERVLAEVRHLLTELAWQELSVQAVDPETGDCLPLSDYAPIAKADRLSAEDVREHADLMSALAADEADAGAQAAETYPASLAGKTVYISAGHGWFWNGSTWRTQRPPWQEIIEDHNNAEAVTQYLIPYLENAGATVVPVRERDWSAVASVADNDTGLPVYAETGTWSSGGSGSGYGGGSYRYAETTQGSATATATWSLNVAAPGTYAVYAWVYPGSNRVPDARYTVVHAGGSSEITLDQRMFPNTWRYLGDFPFQSGLATVRLDNTTGASGGPYAAIADAIRIGGGTFDSLAGLPLLTSATTYAGDDPPGSAPNKPWWETSTFYWSQHVGFNPNDARWDYYNDVVARPMVARWFQSESAEDAVYISWHTNGSGTHTASGTVSYVHNGETYPRTDGSLELQSAVHDELVRDIRAGWDPAWPDRGKGKLNLGEMRMLWDPDYVSARMPGVLLEIAFHDDYEDALALKDPGFNQLSARAVYQGIVAYFDNLDGHAGDLVLAPEPPSHLRVENIGAGSLRVSWVASPTDSVGLVGDAATAYRVYSSADGFGWSSPTEVVGTETVLSGLANGETRYVKVTGINDGGESYATEVLGARVGEAHLLLVYGFDKLNRYGIVPETDPVEGYNVRMWVDLMNSRDYVVHHGQSVPGEYAWDSASNEAVAAGHLALAAYDVVDWILGEETTAVGGTLDSTERALLDTYLAGGRGLLISGSELGWELEGEGVAPDWLHNTLHVDYVADDADTYSVGATAGGAFDGIGNVSFDAPGEYDVDWPDVFSPLGGQVAMAYASGPHAGNGAAVQYAAGCRRLLVVGFPFETLRVEQRAGVMAKALEYLDACTVDTTITQPSDAGAYGGTVSLQGTAVGEGLIEVQLQLRRGDGQYWMGAGWTGSESWFPAVGTASWSYVSLAWPDADYTLRAEAVTSTAEDATPAEVTFTLDRVPPAAPTPIGPSGGITITGPVVSLSWTDVSDGGSDVHYNVEFDGRVDVTVSTPYTVSPSPSPGAHTWRVQAEDAAGHASGWSADQAFGVEVKQVFLPLVLRQG